ncbi:MAG TPA: TonB-dependent receptor [Steroidobacteraceae bacterium]|nr:TonB-dependent receptor [Steroidobacteraceae bacterium]
MTRSRLRKLRRIEAKNARGGSIPAATARPFLRRAAPVASALLSCMPAAWAADETSGDADAGGLAEVVVTATKRAENMQDIPISIQAFGTEKLEQMNVSSFDDYAKMVPSLSFQNDGGPSFEHVYMRGVASGGDGNHSGSQPSVGMYLDEQPVTTIDGNLNLHIYDIQRIEALSGPQGTLYGASSESGTIRIITNKPDPKGFAAGYDLEGNSVQHGGLGDKFEGFANIPLADFAAVRLVGWYEKDAGFIDNVHGTAYFPNSDLTVDNAAQVRKDINTVETKGGRAALKIDLNDNWSILPQIMGQVTDTGGNFAYNPAVGPLETVKFLPESTHDSWMQSALTIEGKIADFDLVYAGAYLTRNTHEYEDYTDYSLAYDYYFTDNAGRIINPSQYIIGRDHYTKLSNELRVTSPQEWPVRFTAGLFQERQAHYILQDYVIGAGGGGYLNDATSIPGWPGTIWLTDQVRTDRDSAAFTEISWDIFKGLTLNTGIRYYTFDNTLDGFYGYNASFYDGEGTATCLNNTPFHGAPCSDLNGRSTGSGNTPKVNLTYKFNRDALVYLTWSKGYRPGGVNRNGGGSEPPYKPDYLTNYELGWKTTWLDNTVRWNGAVFWEKWKSFQFSFLGPNALTIIANAGNAEVKGVESDLEWAVTRSFTLSANAAYMRAKLTQEYCDNPAIDPTTDQEYCHAPGYEDYAPAGTRLPITPNFKGNVTARYNFPVMSYTGYVQGSAQYIGARTAELRTLASDALGQMPSYATMDVAAGLQLKGITAEFYVTNLFDRLAVIDRYGECDPLVCGAVAIYNVPNQPRTFGIRFGQRF